ETKGMPALKTIYNFYDAGDNVSLYPHLEFGHNYNFVSRNDMYGFMIRYLGLEVPAINENDTIEKPFEPLTIEEMTVWTGEHKKPSGDNAGDTFERRLVREMDAAAQKQLDALKPQAGDSASLAKYREVVGEAVKTMIGREMPKPEDVKFIGGFPEPAPDCYKLDVVFRNTKFGENVNGVMFLPRFEPISSSANPSKRIEIIVTGNGYEAFMQSASGFNFKNFCKPALQKGVAVVVLDLFGQGELARENVPADRAKLLGYGNREENWQNYLGYTYGYNHPVFAERVHDILTVIATFEKNNPSNAGQEISLIGISGGAPYAAAARAIAGKSVDTLSVSPESFRFANVERLDDPNLLPGMAKYHDLQGLLALSAPYKTTISLSGSKEKEDDYKLVKDAFDAAGSKSALKILP
ncbi:MAG: hypothetical protein ACRC2T_07290, partial [Thermoguttaceae bacterium]